MLLTILYTRSPLTLMKKQSLALLGAITLGVLLSACSPEGSAPNDGNQQSSSAEAMTGAEAYVGLTVSEAEELAGENRVPFRVIVLDGQPLPATMDYRPGRVNAAVEGDTVVSVDIEGEGEVMEKQYSADSWKTMIPGSCTAFFDGCNTCQRAEGSEVAACTKKFCQKYEMPRCLDEEEVE